MIDDLQIAALTEAAERLNARADQAVATAREAMRRLEAGDYAGVEALAERAAVVAWLREHADAEHPIERGVPALSPAGRGLLLLHADRIERGEHRRQEER